MSRDLEKAFTEQARQLFGLCSLYIDGSCSPDEKDDLLKEIADAFDNWRVDFKGLYDEITANLDEPMSEQQRERYCFSLITPFEAFSKTLYPKWLIGKSQESIKNLQGVDGADKMVSILEKQIADANRRANSYWRLGYSADGLTTGDEAKSVFFELAQIISSYGNLLDAAFVLNGLDLKQLQEICSIWVKQFIGGDCAIPVRALEIKEYIGSETLAEEYLRRLPQEQPEPQQINQEQQKKQQPRRRGRPTEPFASKMIDDANGDKLKKMHKVLAGKKGKDFALLIWACTKKGWCNKPTYTQAKEEFGDIGSDTGYNRYLNNINMFTQEEKDGALKSLD